MNDRLLTSWIERGWVPPPEQHGLGQGKGSISGWSHEQVGFWLAFLHHYQQEVPFRALYNVPVYGWLHGGEAGGISLAQAQRAMWRWAKSQPLAVNSRRARREAHRQVSELAQPAAKGTSAVVRGLAAWHGGQELDLTEIAYLLEPVLEPYNQQSGADLPEAIRAAAGLYGMKEARKLGLTHLEEIPPTLWEWARSQVLLGEAQQQLGVAALGKMLATGYVTFRHLAGKDLYTSCVRLITTLGLAYLFTHEQVAFSGYPPVLLPKDWESGARTAQLMTRLEHSPILLPNGRHPYTYFAMSLAFTAR